MFETKFKKKMPFLMFLSFVFLIRQREYNGIQYINIIVLLFSLIIRQYKFNTKQHLSKKYNKYLYYIKTKKN